jgi:serpin B
MNLARSVVALAALTMVTAACGGATGPSEPPDTAAPEVTPESTTTPDPDAGTEPFAAGDVIQVDLPRAEPDVTAAEIAAVTRGDRALGLDLMRVAAGDANLMVSPYSVAVALSMLYPGARGRTAEEIAAVLHLEVDDGTLHAVRNAIDTALSATPPPSGEDDTREPFTIRPANSAWGQGGYPFLDEYLSVLAAHYGAGLRLVDFVGDPEGATDIINDWVEDATEDRIRDLIPEETIDELTRLVLVNAIWFKANWAEEFSAEATAPGPFTLIDGSEVETPLMRRRA